MLKQKLIQLLIRLYENNEYGFTYQFKHNNNEWYVKPTVKKDRYIISTKTIMTIDNNNNKKIYINDKVLQEIIDKPINEKIIIGAWLNIDNNKYEIELNLATNNKQIALTLGKKYKQAFVYDMIKHKLIRIKRCDNGI